MAHVNNLDIIQETTILDWLGPDSQIICLDISGYHYSIYPPMMYQPGYSIKGPGLWAGELSFADALDQVCSHARQYQSY